MTMYRAIDENVWNNFGAKLLSNKGSETQIIFLQSCRSGKDTFLQYLDENLFNEKEAIINGKNVFFDYKFTEAEFRFPPIDTQKIIWDKFENISKQNMGSCGFWGNIIIDMIKDDCIKPDYFGI